jgi:hypothetical protein
MADILDRVNKLITTSPLKSWRETINLIIDYIEKLAPKNHASKNKEFGGATNNEYGHVKLLDGDNNNYGVDSSVAVTPKALYDLKSISILKGSKLTIDNIDSISGSLIRGNIDLGTENDSVVKAHHFEGLIDNAITARKAERDRHDRVIDEYYVLKESLKQDLKEFNTITNGNLYINSSKNSVICKNNGSAFQLLVANTINGTPNNTYIPLQFDLATTTNEYTGNIVSGKMTVGGDLHAKGTITADGKVYNAVSNDYAEFFEKGEETEVGDIIALDLSSDEEIYVKASKENPIVVGVHSDTYGYILGGSNSIEESEKTYIPVGLTGRVKTKIIGAIEKGEFVVISDIAGVGCAYDVKTNNPLDVIGVAVESSNDTEIKLVKIKLK